MVNIEQRTLSTLEQDVFTIFACLMQELSDISNHRNQTFCPGFAIRQSLGVIHSFDLMQVGQHKVVIIHDLFELLRKSVKIHQVTQAQATTSNLIFIGRTDTSASGADFVSTAGGF